MEEFQINFFFYNGLLFGLAGSYKNYKNLLGQKVGERAPVPGPYIKNLLGQKGGYRAPISNWEFQIKN